MKNTIRVLAGAAALTAAAAFHPLVYGQTAVSQTTTSDGQSSVTQTTTSQGTISEFTPGGDTVVIRGEAGAEPMRYSYSRSTTVVDENGNPVDVSVVKSGLPVQVYYDRDGDRMIARKIVVRHHEMSAPASMVEKESTTTTTTEDHDRDRHRDHDH